MRSSHRTTPTNGHEQVLAVEAGEVACPRRGVVDLELCFQCAHFRGFREGLTDDLVCGYETVLGIPDFTWGVDAGTRR